MEPLTLEDNNIIFLLAEIKNDGSVNLRYSTCEYAFDDNYIVLHAYELPDRLTLEQESTLKDFQISIAEAKRLKGKQYPLESLAKGITA